MPAPRKRRERWRTVSWAQVYLASQFLRARASKTRAPSAAMVNVAESIRPSSSGTASPNAYRTRYPRTDWPAGRTGLRSAHGRNDADRRDDGRRRLDDTAREDARPEQLSACGEACRSARMRGGASLQRRDRRLTSSAAARNPARFTGRPTRCGRQAPTDGRIRSGVRPAEACWKAEFNWPRARALSVPSPWRLPCRSS